MNGFQAILGENQAAPPKGHNGRKRIRCKLETASDITYQAKLLYRRVLAWEISPETAGKLAFLLQTIAKLHEVSELERRLDEALGEEP